MSEATTSTDAVLRKAVQDATLTVVVGPALRASGQVSVPERVRSILREELEREDKWRTHASEFDVLRLADFAANTTLGRAAVYRAWKKANDAHWQEDVNRELLDQIIDMGCISFIDLGIGDALKQRLESRGRHVHVRDLHVDRERELVAAIEAFRDLGDGWAAKAAAWLSRLLDECSRTRAVDYRPVVFGARYLLDRIAASAWRRKWGKQPDPGTFTSKLINELRPHKAKDDRSLRLPDDTRRRMENLLDSGNRAAHAGQFELTLADAIHALTELQDVVNWAVAWDIGQDGDPVSSSDRIDAEEFRAELYKQIDLPSQGHSERVADFVGQCVDLVERGLAILLILSHRIELESLLRTLLGASGAIGEHNGIPALLKQVAAHANGFELPTERLERLHGRQCAIIHGSEAPLTASALGDAAAKYWAVRAELRALLSPKDSATGDAVPQTILDRITCPVGRLVEDHRRDADGDPACVLTQLDLDSNERGRALLSRLLRDSSNSSKLLLLGFDADDTLLTWLLSALRQASRHRSDLGWILIDLPVDRDASMACREYLQLRGLQVLPKPGSDWLATHELKTLVLAAQENQRTWEDCELSELRGYIEEFRAWAGKRTALGTDLPLERCWIDLRWGASSNDAHGRSPTTVLNEYHCVYLVGEAGAGKTSALLRLACQQARIDASKAWSIPVFVRLAEYAAVSEVQGLGRYILECLRVNGADNRRVRAVQRALRSGRCLVVFDGWDEVPSILARMVEERVREFFEAGTAKNQIVISSRPVDVSMRAPREATTFYVLGAQQDQVTGRGGFVARRWNDQDETTRARIGVVIAECWKQHGQVLGRPVLLAALAVVIDERLREGTSIDEVRDWPRGRILEACALTLAGSRPDGLDLDGWRRELARIAYLINEMDQSASVGRRSRRAEIRDSFTRADILEHAAADKTRDLHAQRITRDVTHLLLDSPLVQRLVPGGDHYIFAHRQLREVLAAIWMRETSATMKQRFVERALDPRWEQVHRLFLGLLEADRVKSFFASLFAESAAHAFRAIPDCRALRSSDLRKIVAQREIHVRVRAMAEIGRRWCVYRSRRVQEAQGDAQATSTANLPDVEAMDTRLVLDTLAEWLAADDEGEPDTPVSPRAGTRVYAIDAQTVRYRETNGAVLFLAIQLLQLIDEVEHDEHGGSGMSRAAELLCRRFRSARQRHGVEGLWTAAELFDGEGWRNWCFVPGTDGEATFPFADLGGDAEASSALNLHEIDPRLEARQDVADFFMMKYAVSNRDYEQFDPTHAKERDRSIPAEFARESGGAPADVGASYPVTSVDWFEAWTYAYAQGFELPTELQFEYAASWDGASKRRYPWGDAWKATACNCSGFDVAAYLGLDRASNVLPVRELEAGASAFGVTQLSGNVWEWCRDPFYRDGENEPGVTLTLGERWQRIVAATKYPVRGGCFFDPQENMETTHREPKHATHRDPDFGFRCVIEARWVRDLGNFKWHSALDVPLRAKRVGRRRDP